MHPRTPPTPAPSEDRLFTDWSSIGSRSPPVVPPPQSVPRGGTLITPGIEDIHETEQAAPQPSQPISQESHIGATSHTVQEDLPTAPTVTQQPLERSNIANERRMTDMGTNTSNVVIEPTGSGPRPLHIKAHDQSSLLIVDVLLPSSLGDHVAIPHVNLSISGYEPDSLRTSGIRSPPVRAWEVSVIPQLDRPGSLPIRDHTRGRVGRFLDQVEPDPSQGGTNVQRASTGRRREYPGGDSDSDGYRRPYRDQRLPYRGGYPGGRPPDRGGHHGGGYPNRGGRPPGRGGFPCGDPLMEEDPLDLLEGKDHQALKDILGLCSQ